MKRERHGNKNKNLAFSLKSLSTGRNAPLIFFLILLALYFLASLVTSGVARSSEVIFVLGAPIPVTTLTGVFSALSNICVILMVLFYGQLGFLTALALLLIQFPAMLMNIFLRHAYSSIPGIFTSLLTIFAMILLYLNNRKLEEYQIRIRDQAVLDHLTGLPNSFACTEMMEDLIRREEPFVVTLVNLNNFKSINDTYGHHTGNEVLKEIAARWNNAVEEGTSGTMDFVTRQAGDEFAIIIRQADSGEKVLHTIRHYEAILQEKIIVEEYDCYVNASFGYAFYPGDAQSVDQLLSYADAAMHKVKRANSSNRIIHFTRDMLETEHVLEMELKIREALEKDLLFYYLQPQYDINRKLRGFEALARMKSEDGKMISPGEFIPVAERVGLIDKVDGHVFQKAAQFFGELIRDTGTDAMLSVNVSVRHLMKNDFLEEVKSVLEISGIPAGQLEIEITESIMIDSAEKALKVIEALKDMGIKIAIDDFGTGYSSLSYLNNFPANLLKVDKSFVDRMNASDSSKQYVAAIISMGHVMNFDVIAEGVEEPDQLDTLRRIGCDYVQGFIWGKPMPPEQAGDLVRRGA